MKNEASAQKSTSHAKISCPAVAHSGSLHAQVSPHDPLESVHELLIGGGVAEGVDGAVEIADEVGEHVDVDVDACRAEAVGGEWNFMNSLFLNNF